MAGFSWLTKLISRVNLVIDFFVDPCDAPVTVYAETLFPALMDLLVDLFAFDVTEYSQQKGISIAYPKDKKGASKTRRGKKGGGRKRRHWLIETLTSDPGEILGKKHARDFGGARRILTGGRAHFWILGGFAQRFAFWLWLIVRLSEFILDWWNGLIAAGYCTERGTPVLLAYEPADATIPLVGWAPVNFWTILKQRGNIVWNVASGGSQQYDLTVVSSFTVRLDNPLLSSDVSVRLRIVGGPTTGKNIDTKQVSLSGSEIKTVGLHGKVPKGSFFAIEVMNTNTLVWLEECHLHAFGPRLGTFDGLLHIARDERGERE